MKSDHIYRNSIIEYDEVRNFIEPIQTTVNFETVDLRNFFKNDETGKTYKELRGIIGAAYSQLLGKTLRDTFYYTSTISYTPHLDGYDFRLHPVDFMNNLFKCYKLDCEIPFINLDDTYGMACFRDYVNKYTSEIINSTTDEFLIERMEYVRNNISDIEKLYSIDINEYIEKFSVPKDILLYLAYKSLSKYNETEKEVYTILPYEYFKNVSHMQTSQYPHMVTIGYNDRLWFPSFRTDYLRTVGFDYRPNVEDYLLESESVIIGVDILRPGSVDRVLSDIVARVRANPNVDYDKYNALFEKKINFYRTSGYKRHIIGKYGLNGYYGFSYPNEYLVFDKFYNSDTIDPTRRTILTHGEAIYALPSDRFGLIRKTKQDIIFEKDIDTRIKKLNHSETFIERLQPIIYGPNVSTSTFEEEIIKNKQKMLINNF